MNKIKRFFVSSPILIAPMLWGIQISTALAASTSGATSPITDASDLQEFLCSVVDWFFWIIIIVSVIMVLYAAFEYVTAGDDTEKTSRARRTLTYAAVGVAVALLAAGFPSIVASVFPTKVSANVDCLG